MLVDCWVGFLQTKTVETLRQTLKTAVLEENKKKELTNVIQAHFKEWLLGKLHPLTIDGRLVKFLPAFDTVDIRCFIAMSIALVRLRRLDGISWVGSKTFSLPPCLSLKEMESRRGFPCGVSTILKLVRLPLNTLSALLGTFVEVRHL